MPRGFSQVDLVCCAQVDTSNARIQFAGAASFYTVTLSGLQGDGFVSIGVAAAGRDGAGHANLPAPASGNPSVHFGVCVCACDSDSALNA